MKPKTYIILTGAIALLSAAALGLRFVTGQPQVWTSLLGIVAIVFLVIGSFSRQLRSTIGGYIGDVIICGSFILANASRADDGFDWFLVVVWIGLTLVNAWLLARAWAFVPEGVRVSPHVIEYDVLKR